MTFPILPASNPVSSGYQISRSVRLRSSASGYFNRTPASTTSQTTWTWSGWVKRGALASSFTVFCGQAATPAKDNWTLLQIGGNEAILFGTRVGGVDQFTLTTSQVFRDPSAWYHIVVAVDTTQATASNRVKIYVNGTQVTAFSTANYPSSSYAIPYVNVASQSQFIGRFLDTSYVYLDGYLTEINFIDGQALTPSSFGSTNATTGVWQPAKYTGTYGTNGFYLNFSDNSAATAAAIGKDYSGNGNNWTPNNISVTAGVTYDSMIDVPTPYADGENGRGNYCVLNPLNIYAVTPSNGNLTASGTNAGYRGTMAIPSSGKWYWETVVTTFATQVKYVGIGQNNSLATGVRYESDNGQKVVDGTNSSYGATWAVNDVIGVAVNADASTITFYKNNVSQGSISYTFLTTDVYVPVMTSGGTTGSDVIQANFGQRPFTYTPPSGFKALNTYNLPASTITNGGKYMAATLYTGTGASQSVTNAGSFKPDLVWMKSRSTTWENVLEDSVRGATKVLSSNLTQAEYTSATSLTSFNSNGFTVGSDNNINQSTQTYVGWQWQAGQGSTSSNTSGSITSTVSVNATAGFSIVTYTGTGANATVGHGLGVAPKMVIVKSRGISGSWYVYNQNIGAGNILAFDQTIASTANATAWNSTSPTSSVFSIGTSTGTNASATTYVAYCWAEIAGFSKFGSYTGNGSTDGPFVYCGFRPRYVLIKRTDVAGQNWEILDSSRNTYNVEDARLFANDSGAEVTTSYLDFVANGIKLRTASAPVNASGSTYIYAAFAENPFANALAR